VNYITYHEWCKHLRDAAIIDRSVGKLARVAAQSGIPLDRLERWLAKDGTTLSHAEFLSLHEVLAETHVLGSESDAATNAEGKDTAKDAMLPQQCGCSTCEDNDISFDESD
jgi:hypothetical protein